jgi:PKHD-type hydroxylase
MIITEPKWKSWIVETKVPLFTPEQCRLVIDAGRRQKPQKAQVGMGKPGGGLDTKKRTTTISWLPFDEMKEMYAQVDSFIQKANRNHFGFEDVHVTEQAQFTEYPEGGFYDWHMDLNAFGQEGQNPIRKISMTLLLSDPSDFTGGDLLFSEMGDSKPLPLKQGQAIFFGSFLRHKVAPVKKGVRKSLVMWFGGPPFK